MTLPLLHGARVTLRPIDDADLDELLAIITGPTVSDWWGPCEDVDHERDGLRNEGSAWTILVEGAIAGWLAVSEVVDPDCRSAGLDIALAPEHQDVGLGPEALRMAIGWLLGERGHHRLTIDPATDNRRAIAAYEAVGFRPVGVMRGYWRDAEHRWRDALLLDLLAGEER